MSGNIEGMVLSAITSLIDDLQEDMDQSLRGNIERLVDLVTRE